MPADVSPTGSGSRENAFTASYRAEWAHFQAAIAGEAKVPVAPGAPGAAQGDGCHLPLGGRRPRRDAVRRTGGWRTEGPWRGRWPLCCAPLLSDAPLGDARSPQPSAPPVRPRRPSAELTVYLMTFGPGPAGLGAVRPQRDLDPRSRCTAPTRPTTTACSTSARRTSSSGSSGGRCGTGWRAFPREPTCGSTSATTARSGCRSSRFRRRARLELQRFLQWNERPENRFYHYDYYRDNCSTRVRDALDRVLGGRIAAQTDGVPDRHNLPIPHPAAHRERSAHLHRAAAGARASGWTGRSPRGRRCFSRSRCGSICAGSASPGPTGRHARWSIGADAVRVHRAAAARSRRRSGCLSIWHRAGARRRGDALAHRRGPAQPARADRLLSWWRRLGAAGGHGGAGTGGALGLHRSRHGVSQRESAPGEPARRWRCCPLVPGRLEAIGTRRRRRSRLAMTVARLSLLGLVLKVPSGLRSGEWPGHRARAARLMLGHRRCALRRLRPSALRWLSPHSLHPLPRLAGSPGKRVSARW